MSDHMLIEKLLGELAQAGKEAAEKLRSDADTILQQAARIFAQDPNVNNLIALHDAADVFSDISRGLS